MPERYSADVTTTGQALTITNSDKINIKESHHQQQRSRSARAIAGSASIGHLSNRRQINWRHHLVREPSYWQTNLFSFEEVADSDRCDHPVRWALNYPPVLIGGKQVGTSPTGGVAGDLEISASDPKRRVDIRNPFLTLEVRASCAFLRVVDERCLFGPGSPQVFL